MRASRLVCVRCESEAAPPAERCACGALVEVRHELPALQGEALRALFQERRAARRGPDRSGVWRYRELIAPDLERQHIVSRMEGNTGLYASKPLGAYTGLGNDLLVKHEGENPTGSFKDRGMCVGVSEALSRGARVLACASTGNTSASLASYAALAGAACVVFVPAGKVASGKIAQTVAYGARLVEVQGSFDDAMRLVEEAATAFGLGLLNSVNPWRIEGQKAIGLELLDDLGWQVPDWIVLPAGNLGNVSALGKALREARAAGLIERLPRVAAVRAQGASPFARFVSARQQRAEAPFEAEPKPETVATAIRIGDPRSWEKAMREVDATHGRVLAVSDDEILAAKAQVDAAGIGCEPASAASVAGVRRLVADGTIPKGARVAAILTGHLLKDPETTNAYHAGELGAANDPGRARPRITVEPKLSAIERALADLL